MIFARVSAAEPGKLMLDVRTLWMLVTGGILGRGGEMEFFDPRAKELG
jgi:hypothetical protein